MSILVAGIGNVFQADDGFGVEVARRLSGRELPGPAEVVDFGIRGFDLAYALFDGRHDLVLLVDTVRRGGAPGTVYVIEPDLGELARAESSDLMTETHGMDPARILAWVQAAGARLKPIRLIGCEPADLGTPEDVRMGLTPPVAAAVDEAVRIIEELCTSWLSPPT